MPYIVKSSLDIGGKIIPWNEREVNKLIKEKEKFLNEKISEEKISEEKISEEKTAKPKVKEETLEINKTKSEVKKKAGEK